MSNHIYPDQSDSAFDMKYTRAKVLPSDLRPKTSNGETRIIGSGIQENATNDPYVLPIASDIILGGVKVGSGLSIDVNGILSTSALSGGVTSVFGRSGDITAQLNDYSFSLISGTAAPTQGGTGLASYAAGDLIYASAANILSKLAKGTDGQVLTLSGGLPVWAAAGGGSSLPDMTGNAGKFLTNNGTVASWNGVNNIFSGTTNNLAGGITAYTVSIPEVTALVAGQTFLITFKYAAGSTGCTLNVNNFGAKPIYMGGTTAIGVLQIGNMQTIMLEYDGSTFQAVTPSQAGIAYLNAYQTFTNPNTFTSSLIASGDFRTSTLDYNSNIFTKPPYSLLSSQLNLGGSTVAARVLLGSAVSGYVSSGAHNAFVYVASPGVGTYMQINCPTISSLLVKKPSGFINGTIADLQTAYFDDAPTGGVNNWSINVGKSKFRAGVTLAPIALVASPENGMLEYDGTHLYFTIGSTRSIIL